MSHHDEKFPIIISPEQLRMLERAVAKGEVMRYCQHYSSGPCGICDREHSEPATTRPCACCECKDEKRKEEVYPDMDKAMSEEGQ